ncbi:DUF6778 family protein [Paracoccaceae bacterium Fryx2]|nr:DUF6778 family protein [Paracoccaceae bacterium Fryx2]
MKRFRSLVALGLALGLSACGSMDPASRGVAPDTLSMAASGKNAPRTVVLATQYQVVGIEVSVPKTLKVSEANMYYPIADIVWRGEQRGDRHAQVKAIFEESLGYGTRGMTKGPKVVVNVAVTRFHCLTEKARYTVGGMHSLHFTLTVRDAASGAVIDGPRKIWADIRASGGSKAIAEDTVGRTQRVVVIENLAATIRRELSMQRPEPAPEPGIVPTSRLDSDLRLSPLALAD